jgi:hypothetical protein
VGITYACPVVLGHKLGMGIFGRSISLLVRKVFDHLLPLDHVVSFKRRTLLGSVQSMPDLQQSLLFDPTVLVLYLADKSQNLVYGTVVVNSLLCFGQLGAKGYHFGLECALCKSV